MNEPTLVKVSATPKGNGASSKKLATLKICADYKKHGKMYLVLSYLNAFIQTLHNMCSDNKMAHTLYSGQAPSSHHTKKKPVQCIAI